MSYELAKKLNLDHKLITHLLSATALDGCLMCHVKHQTSPVTMCFKDGHTEQLSFFLYHSVHHPLILGFLWLKFPHIDWSVGKVLNWGENCEKSCLPVPQTLMAHRTGSKDPDLSGVPWYYLDLREVFSKSKATSLPPHRDYDYFLVHTKGKIMTPLSSLWRTVLMPRSRQA